MFSYNQTIPREDFLKNVTEVDWVYAAATIDNEGWIGIARGKGYNRRREQYQRYQCTVRVGTTSPIITDWLQSTFGGSVYFRKWSSQKWKDQYHWVTTVGMLEDFLTGILPYMKLKRRQAELALEYIRGKNVNNPEWRESMATLMNALNRKGKPVTTNTPDCTEHVQKIESELTGDRESEPAVTQDEAPASLPV